LEEHTDKYNAIFRGIIVAIPILFILFLLLSGADPIFRTLVGKLSFSISQQLVISVILFIICFVWGITSILEQFISVNDNVVLRLSGEKFVIESLIVLFSIAALFAVFLLVQLR